MKRIHIVVRGQVQGVGYRYYCQVQAVRLGLTGFARNKDDGSVEVEAQGSGMAIEEFTHLAALGPKRSIVTGIEREDRPISSKETAFETG
jgi:acylphosphatase